MRPPAPRELSEGRFRPSFYRPSSIVRPDPELQKKKLATSVGIDSCRQGPGSPRPKFLSGVT
jgi:hypothetical protein